MKTITIKEGCSTPVCLGEKGENGVGAVLFDYSEWLNDFGNGAISLLVKRKGDTAAYPVVLSTADGIATWTISDTDTAVQGYGKAEYIFTIDSKVAKSAVFSFFVAHDLGPAGDPPDPYESWIDTLTALGGETLINAQAAQAAQEAAETAQANAETAEQTAEGHATNAAQSAGAARFAAESALASADSASASATTATASATAASASATQAAASASAAEASETAAYDSANTAAEEAEVARSAATTATTAATNASTSASSASTSASAASGSASSASASATTATNAATSATQSANNASQSASAASVSATQASNSALSASDSATSAEAFATAAAESEANAEQSATEAEASAQEAATEAAKLNNYLPVDTASGSIASFPDGASGVPVEALSVSLEPVQDLHGQTSPYPAGGGVNKFAIADAVGLAVKSACYDLDIDIDAVNETIRIHGTPSWTASGSYAFRAIATQAGYWGTTPVDHDYTGYNAFTEVVSKSSNITSTPYFSVSSSATIGINSFTVSDTNAVDITLRLSLNPTSTPTAWSPYENLCPITGHTQAQVWRSGVNVWDEEWVNGFINDSGVFTARNDIVGTKNAISVKPNTTYAFARPNVQGFVTFWKNAEAYDELVSTDFISRSSLAASVTTFTTPDNCYAVHFNMVAAYGSSYGNNVSVNYPSTDTNYHTYKPIVNISIPLGQTVYGGSIDVVGGVLTITDACDTFDGSDDEGWKYYSVAQGNMFRLQNYSAMMPTVDVIPAISNAFKAVSQASRENGTISSTVGGTNVDFIYSGADSVASWKTWLASNNVQLCYELAQPITIDLTPEQLTTLLGTNNIWSDSGDVAVEYRADIQKYIAKVISEALA